MRTLFIDFETYFYDAYTLRAMSTWQYIRDPRFQVLGAAVAWDTFPVAEWQDEQDLIPFLRAVDWEDTAVCCHNASFDVSILTHLGFPQAALYLDTMFLARYAQAQGLLNPEVSSSLASLAPLVRGEKGDIHGGDLRGYAKNDLDITMKLHALLHHLVPPDELDYMDLHVRMAAFPVVTLDTVQLQALADKDASLEDMFPLARNDKQFAAALESFGVPLRWKRTPKGMLKLATSKPDGWMEQLRVHADARVRFLADVRVKAGSSIERTRARTFLEIGSPLPVQLLYYGAHTGRASGWGGTNLQNLPRDGGMRSCLMAPEGHVFVIVDSAQVEARGVAWLAGAKGLLSAYSESDPYVAFGARFMYRCSPSEVTTPMRHRAKQAVLGLGFGMGPPGFRASCERVGIPITVNEAAETVSSYRNAAPEVVAYWHRLDRLVRQNQAVTLPSGRRVVYQSYQLDMGRASYLPGRMFRKAVASVREDLWYGAITENVTQAHCRDVVFWQTQQLVLAGAWVALMVHDEAVLVVREEEAEVWKVTALKCFSTSPPWAQGMETRGSVLISKTYVK